MLRKTNTSNSEITPETRYLVWISTKCQEKYTTSENTVHKHTHTLSQLYKTPQSENGLLKRQHLGSRQIV